MNSVGFLILTVIGVTWLLAHLEAKRDAKKRREEADGTYHPASLPVPQRGNYRNSEGSGYEDLAMRDKDID